MAVIRKESITLNVTLTDVNNNVKVTLKLDDPVANLTRSQVYTAFEPLFYDDNSDNDGLLEKNGSKLESIYSVEIEETVRLITPLE